MDGEDAGMFGRGSSPCPVQTGDRYRKVGDQFGKVWEVTRVWTTVDDLLHARMRSVNKRGETRIISVSALTDRLFFTPVAAVTTEF